MSIEKILSSAKGAIVKVGDGRGFVVEGTRRRRYVITAAHCLPHLPPAHPFSYTEERTYHALLGTLGAEATVSAECVFVDPVTDIAVLGEPDNQTYFDGQWEAYLALVDERPTVRIGVPAESCDVWLHTLDGQWEPCAARTQFHPASGLTLIGAKEGNRAGTSGSPIVRADGRALGVISVGSHTHETVVSQEAAGQPLLASKLPLWLLTDLRVSVRRAHTLCRLDPLRDHLRGMLKDVFPEHHIPADGQKGGA
jgi:hypothetical protein